MVFPSRVVGSLVLALVAAVAANGSTRATSLGWTVERVCPTKDTYGFHLNDRGDVIWTDQTSPQFSMGFIWRHEVKLRLGKNESTANALNDSGQVVGWSDQVKGGGYLWENGKFVRLLTHPGNVVPMAISATGDIVGALEPAGGTYYQHAFLWRHGHASDLGAVGRLPTSGVLVDDRGTVVGTASDKTGAFRLFRSAGGKIVQLRTPGWLDLWPIALTNDGRIFGVARRANPRHAPGEVDFLWDNGRMIDLGTLGGRQSDALAINASGQVAGWYRTRTGATHAFLWQRGSLRDLGVGRAIAINARGDVVGTNGAHGFLWRGGKAIGLGLTTPIAINDHEQILTRQRRSIVLLSPH